MSFMNYCRDGLFTDFYELTMAQGYFLQKRNEEVVFECFFRRQPFNGGFSVFAGIEPLIEALEDFSFSSEDIAYLKEQKIFDLSFLDYLSSWHFKGDLYSFDEGSLIFPQEPVIRICSNLIDAQIIEGLVLNTINFQSLIATKSARVYIASNRGKIMEFGLRRAQGADGALSASRASYIGGIEGTSNALAGKIYGIPVMGTMAHSWVMSFPSEEEAFEAYAQIYPENSVFLIDTYDTIKSGIKNAIKAGSKLVKAGFNFGVRLDSGDIDYLSRQVRSELDKAGFPQATIAVSNELTEDIIDNLVKQGAPIDNWGVGTNMVTGGSESSFSGVYKLSAKKDINSGKWIPVMKFSDNPAKTTNPGLKNVYRLYDENNMAIGDILTLDDESIEAEKEYRFFHPMVDYRQFLCKASRVKSLLKKKMSAGKAVESGMNQKEILEKSRKHFMEELDSLDPTYMRILNPHIYKVSLSEKLRNLKVKFIEENLS